MIGNITYEQAEAISISIEQATKEVKEYIKGKNIYEGYAKYLKTTIELNKDADKALEDLKKRN